jgi:hypothetical protein
MAVRPRKGGGIYHTRRVVNPSGLPARHRIRKLAAPIDAEHVVGAGAQTFGERREYSVALLMHGEDARRVFENHNFHVA